MAISRRKLLAVTGAGVLALGVVTGASSCGTTATQQQAGAQANAQPGAAVNGQRPDMKAMLAAQLDPLVDEGTISSEQEQEVLNALESAMPAGGPGQGQAPQGQAPQGQTPPPTAQGGQGPGQGGPAAMFSSTLAQLVKDGTITSTQSEAILKALSVRP
jgi:hypothetical protein